MENVSSVTDRNGVACEENLPNIPEPQVPPNEQKDQLIPFIICLFHQFQWEKLLFSPLKPDEMEFMGIFAHLLELEVQKYLRLLYWLPAYWPSPSLWLLLWWI